MIGPVDSFLAMAAHATGEQDLATRHADEAARLCAEWEIPLAASWFAGVREKLRVLSAQATWRKARASRRANRRG